MIKNTVLIIRWTYFSFCYRKIGYYFCRPGSNQLMGACWGWKSFFNARNDVWRCENEDWIIGNLSHSIWRDFFVFKEKFVDILTSTRKFLANWTFTRYFNCKLMENRSWNWIKNRKKYSLAHFKYSFALLVIVKAHQSQISTKS